jgi:hypothetical protein
MHGGVVPVTGIRNPGSMLIKCVIIGYVLSFTGLRLSSTVKTAVLMTD